MRLFFGVAALASAIGCGGSDDAPFDDSAACIPNQTQVCACPSGDTGAKECRADGAGYGPCVGCAPNGCESAKSCFDACTCKGGDPKQCVTECTSGGSGGTPSPSTGGAPNAGGATSTGGTTNTGGTPSSGGTTGCEGCVTQSCPTEFQSCSSTDGCIDLVLCAQSSGCSLSDYGCLIGSCGTYLVNFGAVGPAMSLGNCAANQCSAECA